MSNKKYRVFFHYYKQYKCMSIHFRNKCMKAKNIECNVAIETKYNKSQPQLVMQGFAESVEIKDDICYIK